MSLALLNFYKFLFLYSVSIYKDCYSLY